LAQAVQTERRAGIGLDLLLLLMVGIWGTNFSVIKLALRDFPQVPFNALRLLLASAVFLIALAARRTSDDPAITRSDWIRLVVLGIVGHLLYQLCFLAGVARTSVANSSLIFGCTPVAVAILSTLAGHDRLTWPRWAGAGLSLAGIYAVVGHRAELSATTLVGDLLVFGGMLCWSLYSVTAQPALRRHSPMVVTGWSMAIGTAFYLTIAVVPMTRTDWPSISAFSWMLMAASSLFALALAYMIWYTAVQRVGSARTSVYSNLTPVVAMIVAAIWLGETITRAQVLGALLIMCGIAVNRLAPSA
jgi:drug/metabolite transporter (DMT)-like permease